MTTDPRSHAAARRLAERPVPWDEVRQRRVLARVEATVAARAGERRRRRWLAGAVASVAAAAGLVLALAWPRAGDPAHAVPGLAGAPVDDATDPGHAGLAASPSIPWVAWPELRLPDRSVAQLRHGARVDVDVQQADLVRLRQHGGEVRYEVAPDRTRAFVVEAADVEVRVVGTIFTVALADDPPRVTVAVERGLVAVVQGEREARLRAGDRLSLELDATATPDASATANDVVVVEAGEPTSRPSRPSGPSVDALLADADAARAGGDLARAAAALSELVRRHGSDPRAYSAYFQLGKVERARGRHAAAAAAFVRCWKRSPRGPLAEDARAEAAESWHAAGREAEARAAAEGYLARHPGGTHHARMQSLLASLR
jgi:transmembrane sensor